MSEFVLINASTTSSSLFEYCVASHADFLLLIAKQLDAISFKNLTLASPRVYHRSKGIENHLSKIFLEDLGITSTNFSQNSKLLRQIYGLGHSYVMYENALCIAASKNYIELTKTLSVMEVFSSTIPDAACYAAQRGSLELVKFFVSSNSDGGFGFIDDMLINACNFYVKLLMLYRRNAAIACNRIPFKEFCLQE